MTQLQQHKHIVEKVNRETKKKYPGPSKTRKQFSPKKVHAMKFKWVRFAYSQILFHSPIKIWKKEAFLFAISGGGLF